jgi:putative ABC transport system ATP-binding protein
VSLDSKTEKELIKLFESLTQESQAIAMVTHNPENMACSSRKIQIFDGKIVNGLI